MSSSRTKKIVLDIAILLVTQAAMYYTVSARAKNNQVLKRLGRNKLELTEYEQIIAAEVIHPDDINIRFSDIGGLDSIISALQEFVIYPLVYPSLFKSSSSLLGAPKGVLLYGPPGCGKTMLAKALAKESGATFINIAMSVLSNKWYGESNKLVLVDLSFLNWALPVFVQVCPTRVPTYFVHRRSDFTEHLHQSITANMPHSWYNHSFEGALVGGLGALV